MTEEQPRIVFNVPASPGISIQMVPLIDIVFQLVCFFLFSTQLVDAQTDRRVALPTMNNPVAQQQAPAEVILNLREDGAITINGQVVGLDFVTGFVGEHQRRARQERRPLRVVVRADRRQPFGKLDEVLQACKRGGLAQVVFRAQGEAGS